MLKKADFYYGSFLSYMINKGIVPALIEESSNRNIYKITTDVDDYIVFTKYISKPQLTKKGTRKKWDFTFSKDDISKIDSFSDENKTVKLLLVCGLLKLKDSEIAILDYEESQKCLGNGYASSNGRISIVCDKGCHSMRAYGTGLADIKDGIDNTIHIKRDRIDYL